jgi:hypothetical protein
MNNNMKPPVCRIHKKEMYLLLGCHRESGGFVDNYWYCGERYCRYSKPARNREEAERETELQKSGSIWHEKGFI